MRVVFCGANFGLVTSYAVPACPAFLGDLPGAPLPHSECLVSSSLFNLGPQDCAAFLWPLFSAGAPLFVKDCFPVLLVKGIKIPLNPKAGGVNLN